MKPSGPKSERQSIHILLVEDDPDDVWVMRNLLGDRWDGPFKLSHAELLSAGLERLSEFPFDIILLDLSLPDSQGLETFFTMHAHAGDVPIVVLTTSTSRDDIGFCYRMGVNSYVTKPATFRGLVELLGMLGRYWFELVELPVVDAERREGKSQ